MSRGQALIELAVCAPVVALLAVGAAASAQIAEAQAGLEAATQAAVAAAARAPDAPAAQAAAQSRFAGVIVAYPLRGAVLSVQGGPFLRGSVLIASSTGFVDVGWAGLVFEPHALTLHATASAQVELWRSRR